MGSYLIAAEAVRVKNRLLKVRIFIDSVKYLSVKYEISHFDTIIDEGSLSEIYPNINIIEQIEYVCDNSLKVCCEICTRLLDKSNKYLINSAILTDYVLEYYLESDSIFDDINIMIYIYNRDDILLTTRFYCEKSICEDIKDLLDNDYIMNKSIEIMSVFNTCEVK